MDTLFDTAQPIMYDSVLIFIESQDGRVLSKLTCRKETVDQQTGELTVTGYLGNMRVKARFNGFSITGSLPKYYFGNNLEMLTRQTTKEAIENLSDALGVAVETGKVYKLEIGYNFMMNESAGSYLRCFGETSRYEKKPYKTGLQFVNSLRALSFYDKQAEMEKKRQPLPEGFECKKVLRYELKLNKNVAKQLGKNNILARDLYEESFCMTALNKWQSEYFKLKRVNKIKIDDVAISSVPQLHKFLGVVGVQTIGEADLISMIEGRRDSLSKGQVARLKKRVNELVVAKEFSEPSEAILELDAKVNEVIRIFRS